MKTINGIEVTDTQARGCKITGAYPVATECGLRFRYRRGGMLIEVRPSLIEEAATSYDAHQYAFVEWAEYARGKVIWDIRG